MIGDEPLVDGEIGYAAQPDLARAPGLRRRPLDRVVEIDRLRERPWFAFAGRLPAAAPVDPHRGVALRHPPLRVDGLPVHQRVRLFLQVARRNPQLVLLIRTQIQDGGKGAGIIRPEHIGFEARAIPHRDVDVFFDDDAVDRHAGSRLHLHCCSLPPCAPALTAHSGNSTFTSSVTFFQYATSALFQACASSIDALGRGLIICCLNAVATCSEWSAWTAALRTISSTSRGVPAGAYNADHRPLALA